MNSTYLFRQCGFSLLETLVALAMTSTLCLSLMRLQLQLFSRTQYMYNQQRAIQAQISLAERIKSCAGDSHCQIVEIERWENSVLAKAPLMESHLTWQSHMLISQLTWRHHKENIALILAHAST